MKRIKFGHAILLIVLIAALAAPVHAADSKAAAIKAYKKYLTKSTVSLAGEQYSLSTARFMAYYLDNNTIPELFVVVSKNMTTGKTKLSRMANYTYSGGKMRLMWTENMGILGSCADDFTYYKKKGVFVEIFWHGDYKDVTYIKKSGNKMTAKLYKSTDYTNDPRLVTTYMNASKRKITKSVFQNTLRSLVGSGKMYKVSLKNNTVANRAALR